MRQNNLKEMIYKGDAECCKEVNLWITLDNLMSQLWVRGCIALSIYILLLVAYAPGGMSPDSLNQYTQARSASFSDWHPPIMAFVWSKLLILQDGPLPMLCFHLGMLVGGSFLLSTENTSHGGKQWAWLLFPLLPWVIGLAGMIWKDVGMAYAFFCAFALITVSKKYSKVFRYICILCAALLCTYGFLVRANAIMAVIPVIFLSLIWKLQINWKISTIISICSIVILAISFSFINHTIIKAKSDTPTKVMLFDEISAASHFAQKNLFPPDSQAGKLSWQDLPKWQVEKGWDKYSLCPEISQMRNTWISVIINHPTAYIQGKARLIKHFCDFPFHKKGDAFSYGIKENDYGFAEKHSFIRYIIRKYVNFFQYIRILYLPILWIPLGTILIFLGIKRKDNTGNKIAILSASGIIYFCGFLLVTPTPDYRFIYWTIISITTALFIFIYSLQKPYFGIRHQHTKSSHRE